MAKRTLMPGLSLVLALCGARLVSAANDKEMAPDPKEERKAQFMEMLSHWNDKPSLSDFMDKRGASLELVAKYHPMPPVHYEGTTLQQKAEAAQAAVAELGMTVEQLKGHVPSGDVPRQYVLDAGAKALDMLAKGFNKHLIPAGRDYDDAERYVDEATGVLQVIAAYNINPRPDCEPFFSAGALFAVKGFSGVLRAAGGDASAACGANNQETQAVQSGQSNQFDPVVAQVGRGVVRIVSAEELPLAARSKAFIDMAADKTKAALASVSGIFDVLKQAEGIRDEMARHAGEYAHGMKGSAAEVAKASAKSVTKVIDAVGDYAAALYEIGGKGTQLINGPVKFAYDKVYECSIENIRVGNFNQTDAADHDKANAVRAAKYKNLVAVNAVQAMAGPYQTWKVMKGGNLAVRELPESKSRGMSAPAAGMSPTMDHKAVKKTKQEAQKLTCGPGEKC